MFARRPPALVAAIVVLAGAVAVALGGASAPAGAAVQSVSPAAATVTPGGGASATVRVQSDTVVCLDVSQPHSTVSASVSPECGNGAWQATLRVQSSGSTPEGTYTVSVSDGAASGSFRLTVKAAPPTTTTTAPRPTTTTARPTTTQPVTTAPPATTTSAPTTTARPTTTVPATTVPLGPGELPGQPFAPVSALVTEGMPERAMFLPLPVDVFGNCLPLRGPCGDRESGLVLVPARQYELRWSAVADPAARPAALDRVDGLESLHVVGSEPPDTAATGGGATAAAAQPTFSLNVLDLTEPAGAVRSFATRLDSQRRLVPADEASARSGGRVFEATLSPALNTSERSEARIPFGRPYAVSTGRFTEASPVLVAYGSGSPPVLYALRTPEPWGFDGRSLPLLGAGRVPYLARAVDGPPGLVVPVPAAMADDLPDDPNAGGGAGSDDESARGGREADAESSGGAADDTTAIIVVVIVAVLAAAGTGVLLRRRFRRPS